MTILKSTNRYRSSPNKHTVDCLFIRKGILDGLIFVGVDRNKQKPFGNELKLHMSIKIDYFSTGSSALKHYNRTNSKQGKLDSEELITECTF